MGCDCEITDNLEYLKKINFQKHLDKITKILKNKKIVIYGTGILFEDILKNYDLSRLDIIAVSDRKFISHKEDETFYNYKVCSPNEIKDLKPDYVLVSTLYFVNIIRSLDETVLNNTKIKIKPLINKPFLEVVKEIWS